ncbi:uncharacterized protein LOC100822292 isoform X1 [Brachypodium distachyon]|uniref:Myb-like domain-containing protein n=1 Tax=Brachypodium distachyon TaxID=15368 RepID=A0A2K2CG11_BRADI|nr:uncharacterized protein LOC100822292 isoform X1 [Brachypodium distachyon]PNT60964.1 hypothetical protein BRADI_5g08662v3 [Brachypodium distachyon]|eukprot:XP_024311235.1 uncharacterized protein LOC100822292 isoform X1 [Brachypodium distachyon]
MSESPALSPAHHRKTSRPNRSNGGRPALPRRDRCRLASAVRREMEEDQSFVDMLSFGGTLQLPCSPLEKQEVPATQESSAVVKAKFTKGKHWSRDEDKVDAVIGTDQQSSLYWGRISEYYNTNKNSSWPERNPNAINCRWNTIREQTNKFCGYFQQIINRNCSGQTTDQKLCTYLFNSIVKFYVLCGSFTYHNFLCSKPRHIFCTRPKILKALLFTFFLRIRRISLHRVRVTSFRRSQQEVCQLVLAQEAFLYTCLPSPCTDTTERAAQSSCAGGAGPVLSMHNADSLLVLSSCRPLPSARRLRNTEESSHVPGACTRPQLLFHGAPLEPPRVQRGAGPIRRSRPQLSGVPQK